MNPKGRDGPQTTAGVYVCDIERIQRLRNPRPGRRKYERYMENSSDVLHRALDALEEKEEREQKGE